MYTLAEEVQPNTYAILEPEVETEDYIEFKIVSKCPSFFYAVFNNISVISRRQFTYSWSLGKQTSTRLENEK